MITADIKKIENQLEVFTADVTKRLEAMVRGFARNIAETAINKTPIGDSVKYARYYNARTYLPNVEGISKGNWQYSETSSAVLQMIAGQASGEVAADNVESKAGSYKLGDSFYIVNTAPYIQALENNKSTQTRNKGIGSPTIDLITASYASDLKTYYDEGYK